VDATDRRVDLPAPSDREGERESEENSEEGDDDPESEERPSLEGALERAQRAVDERVGILSQVGERESFPIPYYVAATADTTGFSDARAAEFAGGADPDWDRAFMKALGEGLERYCAGVYRADGFERAPAASLRGQQEGRVVGPEEFVTPDDYGDGGDPERSRPWVRGTRLREAGDAGESAWLPAESVFYPPVERRFAPAITTGLGLGNTATEAVLSGLYEVIERDATMLAWYSTFEPLKLEFDGELTDLRKRARAESLTATVLLVTQDVDVPVVAAAVHRDPSEFPDPVAEDADEWPAFATGSGASLDPVAAARSALAEALQNWTELRAMGPANAEEQGGAIGRYAGFPGEARAFVDAAASVPAATLGEPERSGRAELDAVLERIETVELEAYAARTTTRDVAGLGFEGARVVVPGAQPLFTGDPFFGDRARTVPGTMGFEPHLDREYHPFP
ncbi:MAG: YcaO-like family protein, partial [Haloferacaceae archaeon]